VAAITKSSPKGRFVRFASFAIEHAVRVLFGVFVIDSFRKPTPISPKARCAGSRGSHYDDLFAIGDAADTGSSKANQKGG
jgi:hypothetical protein